MSIDDLSKQVLFHALVADFIKRDIPGLQLRKSDAKFLPKDVKGFLSKNYSERLQYRRSDDKHYLINLDVYERETKKLKADTVQTLKYLITMSIEKVD